MSLNTKAVLIKVDFSIPSGRKVDKAISNKVADDYNVSGGRASSGNFNKIAIAQKYFKPFVDIKRRVENSVRQNTLPYLHESDNTFILPNSKIMDMTKIIRDAENEWEIEKDALVNGKYDEAMEEAKQRLNDSGGMFKYSDYPDVNQFVSKFKMGKFMRPIPDIHGLEFLTNVSELEAESIKKEVKQSMDDSLQSSMQCLYDKIHTEMDELIDILSKDNPRIFKSRIDGLNQTIRMIRELNFTNDQVLEDVRNYMVEHLLLTESSLTGNRERQDEAIADARYVKDMLDGKNTPSLDVMEKIYGYGS